MDSWEGSHDDGEWIRPGEAGRSGPRREAGTSDPYDDGSFVRAVPREEAPPALHEQHRDDPPRHDTYDGYGYGDDDQYGQGYAAADPYADVSYGRDVTHGGHGGGGTSPFATGWLPLWPTIGIAFAAVILAFIIGHVTAGGGSDKVATTVTTQASTTTTTVVILTDTVGRGDTLSAIARRNGVTTDALATYNSITNPSLIYVGQVLKIPPH